MTKHKHLWWLFFYQFQTHITSNTVPQEYHYLKEHKTSLEVILIDKMMSSICLLLFSNVYALVLFISVISFLVLLFMFGCLFSLRGSGQVLSIWVVNLTFELRYCLRIQQMHSPNLHFINQVRVILEIQWQQPEDQHINCNPDGHRHHIFLS